MTYERLMRLAEIGLGLWLITLIAIVLWRLLISADALSGLLKTKPNDGQLPERMQNLAIVMVVVAYYVAMTGKLVGSGEAPHRMPELPDALLALVGGSQAIFLAGKTARLRRR